MNIWFGPGCEPTNVGLVHCGGSRLWTGSAFTKTQWAENYVKAHATVCAFLRRLEQLGILESVDDEGGYGGKWDITRLIDAGQGVLEVAKQVQAALQPHLEATGLKLEGPATRAGEMLEEHQLEPGGD